MLYAGTVLIGLFAFVIGAPWWAAVILVVGILLVDCSRLFR